MKKFWRIYGEIIRAIGLALVLLISLLSPLLPFLNKIQIAYAFSGSSNVSSTTSFRGEGTIYPFQPKLFYAQNLIWAFYAAGIGGDAVFRTSSDNGVTWSAPTSFSVGDGFSGYNWSIWVDTDNTMSYVRSSYTKGVSPIFYRKAQLNSNGTVTYLTSEQTVIGAPAADFSYRYVTIFTDSNHNPWVGYVLWNETLNNDKRAVVTTSSTNNGTWTTLAGFPYTLQTGNANSFPVPMGVSLPNGKVYFIYQHNQPASVGPVYGNSWNGTTWAGEEQVTTSNVVNNHIALVSDGNTIHLVGLKIILDPTRSIIYTRGNYGSWSPESTVYTTNDPNYLSGPAITLASSNSLVVSWTLYGYVRYIWNINKDSSDNWSSANIWVDLGSSHAGTPDASDLDLNLNLIRYGDSNMRSGLLFVADNSSPWMVIFAGLDNWVAPTMVTNTTTGITMDKDGVTGGTFSGNLTAFGGSPSDNVSFEYGLTIGYGSETTPVTVNTTGQFTASMPTNLTPGATYHYRAKGQNDTAIGYGADQTFTLTMPSVTTSTPGVNTLFGSIDNMGVASSAYVSFDYGTTIVYGFSSPETTQLAIGAFSYAVPSIQSLHYRAKVRVGATTVYGSDQFLSTTATQSNDLANNLIPVFAVIFAIGLSWKAIESNPDFRGILLVAIIIILTITAIIGGHVS